MSLEKRKETKEEEKKRILEESTFRRHDFAPLDQIIEPKEKKSVSKEVVKDKIITDELTQLEQEVLEIAKDVLKLKRYDTDFEIDSEQEIQKYPIIEKLYAKCIAKLSYKAGYSKNDIFLAIRSLEEKYWIVTHDRRTKSEILENEKLMTILNFVKNNPGIHARDERINDLGITRTPFLKHIMTLERFKLIRSTKIGKTLHFFPNDTPNALDDYKVIFLNPLIPSILEHFFREESVNISQIAENLDIYSGTIQYHIKKLKELDILKSTKDQTGKKIHVVNIELLKKYNDIFKEPDFSNLLRGL